MVILFTRLTKVILVNKVILMKGWTSRTSRTLETRWILLTLDTG